MQKSSRVSKRIKPQFTLDAERACSVGTTLLEVHSNGGIFGNKVTPQHQPPERAVTLEERLRFVTFAVALDYLRDSTRLYNLARETYDDPETTWLFDPTVVADAHYKEIFEGLKKHKLAQREVRDTDIWSNLAKCLVDRFSGSVRNLLESAEYYGPQLLITATRFNIMGLMGPKIGPLWLRMLNDCCTPIKGIEEIPLPVDRHIVSASFACGVIVGEHEGLVLDDLTEPIQTVWRGGGELGGFAAIQLDVPMWYLGRLGCSKPQPCNRRTECPVIKFCTKDGRHEVNPD